MCPAVRFSRHLQSPQIARVNADSLSFTTTALASNRPSALQPHGFADLCITRCSGAHRRSKTGGCCRGS
ncbi:hypothetical protein CJO80_02930 [Ralstonia solanacearum]|nr:hypothetical protein CJO80_02930 [Ralstonia solanacearum]